MMSFYWNEPWVVPTIALVMCLFATLFYFLIYNLVAGLKASALNYEEHWKELWTTRLIHILATIALFNQGGIYLYVVCFILPWIIVNVMSDTLNTLVQMEIIGIEDSDE